MSENEQFKICNQQFTSIHKKLDEISSTQKEFHERLFIDNGRPSIQTMLDRNTRWIKAASAAIGTVYVGIVGYVVWLLKK